MGADYNDFYVVDGGAPKCHQSLGTPAITMTSILLLYRKCRLRRNAYIENTFVIAFFVLHIIEEADESSEVDKYLIKVAAFEVINVNNVVKPRKITIFYSRYT